MTNWDNYFTRNYNYFEDIHSEIFSDNGGRLGINTFLFAILVRHIEDDYIPFSLEDFETIASAFINSGCARVQWAFTKDDLLDFLDRFSSNDGSNYFTKLPDGTFIANMDIILGNQELTLNEKAFCQNDPREMRKFVLFCRLHLSMKATYAPYVYALRLQKLVGE